LVHIATNLGTKKLRVFGFVMFGSEKETRDPMRGWT